MNMMSRHFRANSAILVFLSIVLANKPSLAGVAADFPRDSIALANVNFSYFISKGNGERKLTSSVSEIGKFLFGTIGSASGLVVLGQCSQSLKGMQSFKYHHSVTDVFNRKNEANNYSLSSASSLSKSNLQSAAVVAQEPKMLSIPSSETTSDTVATQSPKTTRATISAPLAALLQSQRLQNCGPNFWPAPEGEPWVALLPSYGTLEYVRAALQLNASAVLIYNATFNDQSLFRNETRAVVVAVSPSVGAEVALRLRQGALVYVSLHKTHHNYPATVNRTSVLFVSVSFILLMIVSLAWLVFYYVQRFRYINAKDRLQRHLSNAAKKALSKIPVKNIKLGDRELALEDSCAVCLEAYTAGDTVRVLPCRHEFHKACVDPWLLDHRTCPMCKMDILRHYGYNLSDSSDSVGNGIIDDDPNIGANNVNNVLTQSLPRAYINNNNNNNNSNNSGNGGTLHPVVRTDAADTAPGTPATSTEAEARDEPEATHAVLSAPPLASPEDASSEQSSPPCTATQRPPGFTQALDSPAPDAGVEAPSSTVISSAHPPSANATAKPESFLRAMLDTARSRVPFSARGFGKLTLEEGKLVDETGGAIREDPRELEASVNQEGGVSSATNASVSNRTDGLFVNDYSSVEDDSGRSSPVLSLHTPRQAETNQDLCDVDSLDSHEFTDALEHMTPRVIVRSAKSKHPVVQGEDPNSALRNSKVSPLSQDQANVKYYKGNKTGNFKRSAPSTISDVLHETGGENDARLSGNVTEAFAGNSHFPVNGVEQGSGVRQENGVPVVKEDRKDGLTLNVLEIPSSPSNTSLFRDAPEPKRRCVTADVRKKSSTARTEDLPGVHKRTTSEDPDTLTLQGLEGSLELDRNARGYFQLSEVEENDPTLRDMRPRVSAVARSFTPLSSSRQDDRSKSEKRNNVCSVRSSRSIPGLSSYAIPGAVAAVGNPISRKKSEPELNTDVRLRDPQQHDGARQQSSAQKYPTVDGAADSATNTTELPSKSAAANRVAVKPAINLLPNDMLNTRRKSPVAPSTVDPYCSHKTDLEDLKRRLTILSDQMPLSPEFLPEASATTSKSRYDLSRMGGRRSSGFDTDNVPHVRNMVSAPTIDTSSRKVSKAGKEAMPRIPSHAISSNFSQKDDRPMTNLSESRQREVEMARRRSRKVAPVPGVSNGDGGGSSLQAKSSARPFSVKEKPNSKEELGQPTQSNKNVFSVSYA